MQIDELRGELTSLADEIQPFAGDATELHRRVRARRIVTASCAVALAVVVAVSTAAVAHNRADNKVQVSGTGSKLVSSTEITHIGVVVVPGTDDVQRALDASPLVLHYARVPRGIRPDLSTGLRLGLPLGARQRTAFCTLETSDGFAVQAAVPDLELRQSLAHELPDESSVFDLSDELGADAEVFLKTGASKSTTATVRARLEADPNVTSIRYVSQADAYEIFKADFSDQPALVQSTKPSDLPASFRVDVVANLSPDKVSERYRHLTGVATVIGFHASRRLLLFSPEQLAEAAKISGPLPSLCEKP